MAHPTPSNDNLDAQDAINVCVQYNAIMYVV